MMAPGVTDCGTEVLVIKQEPFQPAEDVNMDISTEIQRGKMPLNEPLLNSHGKLDPYIQIVDKVKDLELQSVGPKQDFKDSGQVDLEQGSDNDTHREEKAKTERRVLRSPPPPSPPTSRKSFPLPPRPPSRPIDSWQGNKGYRVPKAPYWNNWPYEQPKRHPSGRYRSPPPPIRIAPTNYALAPRYKDERSPTSNIWCKDTYERSLPSPRAYAMRHSPYSRRSYPILPPIDPRVALSTPMDPRQNRHETHIEPHSPFQTDRSPVPQKKSSVPKSK
ncbi:hypothetical protein BCR41DRAFT_207813 [Lobosporangium transversale]|uniref:Uncharacterized protein n=1 Tax=Lobosporangium transversale TaxID=64571 RepID=A0A1Y2GAV9_9FUNG|nr:hypothetical protein BCR41DRAFT_207813 [Lobosporangium transversale]ORZ04089.1 hypothetical protein BCR41DRAFT_207813 [Lobosporangium transversale]|eukprot:XP_021876366.1 hypothetical protein BCR41DRAFT_207813 [Lobosporangium transversale]